MKNICIIILALISLNSRGASPLEKCFSAIKPAAFFKMSDVINLLKELNILELLKKPRPLNRRELLKNNNIHFYLDKPKS